MGISPSDPAGENFKTLKLFKITKMTNSEKHKYFVRALELIEGKDSRVRFGICKYLNDVSDSEKSYWDLKDHLEKYRPKKTFNFACFYPMTKQGRLQRIKLLKKIIKDLEKSL